MCLVIQYYTSRSELAVYKTIITCVRRKEKYSEGTTLAEKQGKERLGRGAHRGTVWHRRHDKERSLCEHIVNTCLELTGVSQRFGKK
jgi:hypothetical protein